MKITMLAVSLALMTAIPAAAELTLFEHDNFNGRHFSVNGSVNNRISSARRISHRYPYNQNPSWGGGDPSYRPGPTDIRQR